MALAGYMTVLMIMMSVKGAVKSYYRHFSKPFLSFCHLFTTMLS